MANQMANFPSSMNSTEPGQSFMIGSMTWVINADGNKEIVETVQDNPTLNMLAPITSVLAPVALISAPRQARRSIDQDDLIASIDWVNKGLAECLSLTESVLDQSTKGGKTPALQGHCAANAEYLAHARHPRWQDVDLVIMATPEGCIVQRRPLPTTCLRLANYEATMENMLMTYPFGLVGVGLIYQDAMHHLFIDHAERSHINDHYQIDLPKADQPAPMVNMVQIR
jgi:hypothetical protein